jgi:hypothetical protein
MPSLPVDPNSLNLQDFYLAAKSLRRDLISVNKEERLGAAERFASLTPLSVLTLEDICTKKISLNQAKQVIAHEMGHQDWGVLKQDLADKIQAIEDKSQCHFVPGELPLEPGEVISGDVIFLGTFKGQTYAIDAILIDVFELKTSPHGPGYEVHPLEPMDFDPEVLPEIPEEEDAWTAWSQGTAEALGLA